MEEERNNRYSLRWKEEVESILSKSMKNESGKHQYTRPIISSINTRTHKQREWRQAKEEGPTWIVSIMSRMKDRTEGRPDHWSPSTSPYLPACCQNKTPPSKHIDCWPLRLPGVALMESAALRGLLGVKNHPQLKSAALSPFHKHFNHF